MKSGRNGQTEAEGEGKSRREKQEKKRMDVSAREPERATNSE